MIRESNGRSIVSKPKLRLHSNEILNDILNRLVELADGETSGFSEEDKARFIEKIRGYDND